MKLYMVRHGQSETNLSKQYTGWSQVNLTEQGYEDARQVGKYLQKLSFDRIYSSDLIRAVQTAHHAIPGCEPVRLKELREIGLGTLELRSIEECEKELGDTFAQNRRAYDFTSYGGENRDMMEKRVRRFFEMLDEDPCENAVAFAHAGTLQTALDVVLGMRLDRWHVACMNGSVAVFEHVNGRWLLRTWGAAV